MLFEQCAQMLIQIRQAGIGVQRDSDERVGQEGRDSERRERQTNGQSADYGAPGSRAD